MGLDRHKSIRTLRIALTCIFLFLLTWYFQVPESAWSLITIFFVMYEYTTIGGVYSKSMLRFSGTILSAIYGMIVVYFCANTPIINMIAFIPGLFVYAYFFMSGNKTYVGVIGGVTLTIVLLNYNDLDIAILRVFNIILGILASVFMIRFFYPQFARDQIIHALWDFLDQFAQALEDYLNASMPLQQMKENYLGYEHTMIEGFASFTRLANEAKIETKNTPCFIMHNLSALTHVRHIFRLLNVFILYLSTEEIRANSHLRGKLSQVLIDLRTLQQELNSDSPPFSLPVLNIKGIKSKRINKDTLKLLETFLSNMNQEIDLLANEIKNIRLIHCSYRSHQTASLGSNYVQ